MYNQITSNKRRTLLLIAIFVVFVLALGWILGEFSDPGAGFGGLVFAGIISFFMTAFSYFKGDSVALWTAGAKPVAKEALPYVYNMVENLCITSGIPVPKIHVIEDPTINAFATGRDPEHASIAITTGAIQKLENEELEGVISHELSHIKNYDIRIMTIVVVLVGTVSLLVHGFLRFRLFSSGSRSDRKDSIGSLLLIFGLVAIIISPIVAQLIQFAISRKREYMADASGALLTRYPEGLARALEKISAQNTPLSRASTATAHLYISNPFGANKKQWLATIFSTHPPIAERIKILRTMGI